MAFLHKHTWVETQNQYYPPTLVVKSIAGYMSFEQEKAVFGYTTVTNCCTQCPKVNIKRYIGEIKTKVNSDG